MGSLQEERLGDFEREPCRREAGLAENFTDGLEEIAAHELNLRDVDGDADIRGPGNRRGCSGFKDPAADRRHQPDRLQDRDEFGGRHVAAHRMPPAQQGFAAQDPAGRKVDNRLVEDLELTLPEGFPQLLFQALAGGDPGRHGGVEDVDRTAAGRLGFAERHFRALHDRQRIRFAGLDKGDADTHPGDEAMRIEVVGLTDAGNHLLGQYLGAPCGILAAQDDRENVGGKARHEIVGAGQSPQPVSNGHEQTIADGGPERVVHRPEAIDIECNDDDRLAGALATLEGTIQTFEKLIAVGQAGKRVVAGEVGNPIRGAATLGHVQDGQRDDVAVGALAAVAIQPAVQARRGRDEIQDDVFFAALPGNLAAVAGEAGAGLRLPVNACQCAHQRRGQDVLARADEIAHLPEDRAGAAARGNHRPAGIEDQNASVAVGDDPR